jgi:hypothetical protein
LVGGFFCPVKKNAATDKILSFSQGKEERKWKGPPFFRTGLMDFELGPKLAKTGDIGPCESTFAVR